MASCAVRRAYAFARNPHELRVELAVGILIVEHRYGICPRRNGGEFAGSLLLSNRGANARQGFLALFWKAVRRRVECAEVLSFVTVQSNDFDVNYPCLRTLGLVQSGVTESQKTRDKKGHFSNAFPQRSPRALSVLSGR